MKKLLSMNERFNKKRGREWLIGLIPTIPEKQENIKKQRVGRGYPSTISVKKKNVKKSLIYLIPTSSPKKENVKKLCVDRRRTSTISVIKENVRKSLIHLIPTIPNPQQVIPCQTKMHTKTSSTSTLKKSSKLFKQTEHSQICDGLANILYANMFLENLNLSLNTLLNLDKKNILKIAGNEYIFNTLNQFFEKGNSLTRLLCTYEYFLTEFDVSQHMERVQVIKNDLIISKGKTIVIGDIHGDMLVLLSGLYGSKMLEINIEHPIMMQRLNGSFEKITIDHFSKLPVYEQDYFQPILNFSFINTGWKDEIVILGDILDRGEHDKACLALLIDLAYRENSPLKIVMGDHELYGLYNLDTCPPIIFPSNYYHNQKIYCSDTYYLLIRNALKKAFRDGIIKLAHVGDGSMLYSHSMLTKNWLRDQKPKTGDCLIAFDYLLEMKFLIKNNIRDYILNLNKVIDYLNSKFIEISINGLENIEDLQSMFRSELSPFWNRGTGDTLPLLGCIGHINQKVFEQRGDFIKSPLLTADYGLSIHSGSGDRSNYYLCDYSSFWSAAGRGDESNWNSVPVYTIVTNGQLEVVRVKKEISQKMLLGTIKLTT